MSNTDTFELLAGVKDETGVVHKEVEFKEMTGAEEEAVSKPSVREKGSLVIKTILERCILRIGDLTPKSMGGKKWSEMISNMLVGDQDYAVLQIRQASLGNDIEMKHKCQNCKADIETTIGIDEIKVTPFNDLWEIPFSLPKAVEAPDGSNVTEGTLRYPTGIDREILEVIAKQNPGQANTMLITRCITDLSGVKVTDPLIRSMSLKNRDYLLGLLRDNAFGVDTSVEIDCPNCGSNFDASLNMTSFF